ncbi:MAG: hypothetical protein AAGB19_01960 [Cyanobacteria bacterium P01_F01_bin.3]
MLAYTTVSDIFVAPTALAAFVYLGGLLFVVAGPYLFLRIMGNFSQTHKHREKSPQNNPAQQR